MCWLPASPILIGMPGSRRLCPGVHQASPYALLDEIRAAFARMGADPKISFGIWMLASRYCARNRERHAGAGKVGQEARRQDAKASSLWRQFCNRYRFNCSLSDFLTRELAEK